MKKASNKRLHPLCTHFYNLCKMKLQRWRTDSVQFNRSVTSDSLRTHGPQHARPLCLSPTAGVYSNSCPLSWWCHPTISSSIIPSIRVFSNESVLHTGWPKYSSFSFSISSSNEYSGLSLGWTDWISFQSKGLSRGFSNTTVKKCQFFWCSAFFIVQLSPPYMTTGKTTTLI